MTPPARIELHIEELVLHGFAPGDRASIGAAVQAELARLLAEHGAPAGWGRGAAAVEQLDGGAFHVAPGTRAATMGAQVARAVYGSLGGSASERTSERSGGATAGQPGGGGR